MSLLLARQGIIRLTALLSVTTVSLLLLPCIEAEDFSSSWLSPRNSPTPILDAAMDNAGNLCGILLDNRGAAVAGARIVVLKDGQEVTSSVTRSDGLFVVAGLRGGVYQVRAGDSFIPVRAWVPGTAPPAAQAVVRIPYASVVRGQIPPDGPIYNPWAVSAAAVLAGGAAYGLYTIDSGS